MKGVLAIKYSEQRFVYQAVHMIFNGNFTEAWEPGEPRENKLVFIGKNLVAAELRAAFEACIATDEIIAKKTKMLRFAIGDKVECKTGADSWSAGTIVELMYRDDGMPPGMCAPYQVKLSEGDLIYAPADEEDLIRKASVPVS